MRVIHWFVEDGAAGEAAEDSHGEGRGGELNMVLIYVRVATWVSFIKL